MGYNKLASEKHGSDAKPLSVTTPKFMATPKGGLFCTNAPELWHFPGRTSRKLDRLPANRYNSNAELIIKKAENHNGGTLK